MEHHTKHNFEFDLLKFLGLEDKHVTWLELRCAYNEVPIVRCEYEIHDGVNPVVRDGAFVTEEKKYKIILEEIEKEAK